MLWKMIFGVLQIAEILIVLFLLIPIRVLYHYYRNTRIQDFFYLLAAFLAGFLNSIFVFLLGSEIASLENNFVRLTTHVTFDLVSLFFFFHVIGINREKIYRSPLFYVGLIWVGFLWIIRFTGFIDTNFVYHLYFSHGFRMFTGIIFILAYLSIPLVSQAPVVRRGRRRWLLAAIIYSLYSLPIFVLYYLGPNFLFMRDIINLLAIIIIAYIAIKNPETMLLTKVQIVRASGLYRQVAENKIDEAKLRFSGRKVTEYLMNLPSDLVSELNLAPSTSH